MLQAAPRLLMQLVPGMQYLAIEVLETCGKDIKVAALLPELIQTAAPFLLAA